MIYTLRLSSEASSFLTPAGMLGAITSRAGSFLSSFQRWREEILLGEAPPVVFADLGYGVLDGAMVEVAAYCLEGLQMKTVFLRVLDADDKAEALLVQFSEREVQVHRDSLTVEPQYFSKYRSRHSPIGLATGCGSYSSSFATIENQSGRCGSPGA